MGSRNSFDLRPLSLRGRRGLGRRDVRGQAEEGGEGKKTPEEGDETKGYWGGYEGRKVDVGVWTRTVTLSTSGEYRRRSGRGRGPASSS